MAYKNPPKHTQFKPGQSGNPGGKKKGLLTADQVKEFISKFAQSTLAEVMEVANDENTPMLEAIFCQMFIKARMTPDSKDLDFMLNRTIGKVKEEIIAHTHVYGQLPSAQEAKKILDNDLKGDE